MKPNLNKEKIPILLLLASAIVTACFPSATGKPHWLANGLYITYEQSFVWPGHSELANMTWQITRIEGNNVDVYLTSHTVNASDSTLNVILVSRNLTINSDSRQIDSSSEPSMTGQRWPFWIETDVTLGSIVDTMFGVASIGGSEVIHILEQQRDTWIVEYNWPTSYMKRWYDKASGIVLKIQVALKKMDTQIQVTETAKWTNLNLPPYQPNDSGQTLPLWAWLLALASIIAIASVAIAVGLKFKTRRGKPKDNTHKTMQGLTLEDSSDI